MSNAVSSASRTRRNAVIVLSAVAVLALLVGGLFLLNRGADTDESGVGDLHELRRDEFATALINAREKAGSWSYLQTDTVNGSPKGVIDGIATWDGKTVNQQSAPCHIATRPDCDGTAEGDGEIRKVGADWFYYNAGQNKKKPWLKLGKGAAQQALVKAMDNQANPRTQLEIFQDPAGFQVIGVENIGVAEAVHYRITVAIEKVKEITSNPVVGKAGDQQVYDVWVNDKDQILKLTIPTDIGVVQAESIITYSRYGEIPAITAPPADQVMEATLVSGSTPGKGDSGN